MKKTFSLLLVICLVLSSVFCCSVSSAAEDTIYNAYVQHNGVYVGYKYTLGNGMATIVNGPFVGSRFIEYDEEFSDWRESYTVPSYLSGYKVIAIGKSAYSGFCSKKIILPNGVLRIGDYAFSSCRMESVVLPNSIESIGEGAFSECEKLTAIDIPGTVKVLRNDTFSGCYNLKKVTLHQGLQSIGDYCFGMGTDGCTHYGKLESIVIPKTVTNIGAYAFSFTNLKSVEISGNISKIKAGTFRECRYLKSIVLPEKITAIGDYAFYASGLKTVSLPAFCQVLGRACFSQTSLSNIVIPNKVKNIASECFSGCFNLKSIKLGDSVQTIGAGAFQGTGIEKLYIPKQVNSISCQMFGDGFTRAKIKTINVDVNNKIYSSYKGVLYNKKKNGVVYYPQAKSDYVLYKGVTTIGAYAFAGSSLKKVSLPSTVKKLGIGSFECAKVTQISIPGKVTNIPNLCFFDCNNLKSVKVPNSIVKIYPQAFTGTSVNYIDLPNSLKTLSAMSLSCDRLYGITIPAGVAKIEGYLKVGEATPFDFIAGYKGTAAEKYCKKYGYGAKFIVAPAIPKFTLVKSPGKGKLQLKWKKASDGQGYQLQISTSATMSENTKQLTIKGNKNVSKNIAKLKSGQVLYIQVRSYRVQKVKGVNRVIYGAWSKTANVKIK